MASSNPAQPHVLIIGAGIGGLFLAQFLRKQGVPYSIFERDASFEARPAGYAIGLNLLDDYTKALPADVPPLRSASHLLPLNLPSEFVMYLPNGMRVGVRDDPETPCVRVCRDKLRRLLMTGVDVQWGKKVVRVDEAAAADTVTVHFDDGSSATGDLLVGVDGMWSKVREHVLGIGNENVVESVPMAIIAGKATLTGAALETQLRLGNSAYIAIPAPGLTLFSGLDRVTRLPETETGGVAGHFYWFLYIRDDDAASPDHWLRTATREAKHAHALARVSAAGLDPRYTAILGAGGPASVSDFLLYHDAILPPLPPPRRHGNDGSGGPRRVLLIGDAAHPMTPFRGEGGITAVKDAHKLSQLLAATDLRDTAALQTALDAFQRDVLKQGAAMVQMSRDALDLNAGPPKAGTKPRAWGIEVRPMPEATGPLLDNLVPEAAT